jgi:hypothetical protein
MPDVTEEGGRGDDVMREMEKEEELREADAIAQGHGEVRRPA